MRSCSRSPRNAHGREQYKEAIKAYTRALSKTVAYLNATRSENQPRNLNTENELSELWTEASIAISDFDAQLANQCFVKGQGWIDPAVWTDERYKQFPTGIDDMRKALIDLNERRSKGDKELQSGEATVFISYNHGDREVADRLKVALETAGIRVRIDSAVMEAGGSIQEFIETSIRETNVTVAIVSNRSLLSAWVALESIGTFYAEKSTGARKFIACYLDDDFFKPDFRLQATRQINTKIAEIDALIPEYNEEKIDTNDLNDQKSRLYKLRNNLGDILQRLRASLCLDIRELQFDESMARLVREIKGSA